VEVSSHIFLKANDRFHVEESEKTIPDGPEYGSGDRR